MIFQTYLGVYEFSDLRTFNSRISHVRSTPIDPLHQDEPAQAAEAGH